MWKHGRCAAAGLVAISGCGVLSRPAYAHTDVSPVITPTRFCSTSTVGWPGPRAGHTLTALDSSRFIMVGGTEGGEGVALNSLFELDTKQMHWRALPDSSNNPLPASISHEAAHVDGGVVCFGGTTGMHQLNGLWRIDVTDAQPEWTVVTASGTPHPARIGHAMTSIASAEGPQRLWLFGGLVQHSVARNATSARNACSTLSAFDLSSGSWTDYPVAESPCARAAHTAVSGQGEQIVVFGGVDYVGKCKLNDVHVYDTRSGLWELDLVTTGDKPTPRSGHCAVMLGSTQMLIFGGMSSNGSTLGDAYVLDVPNRHWRRAQFAVGSKNPSPRFGAALVEVVDTVEGTAQGAWDQERHVVWLYGGSESRESTWFQFFGGNKNVPCADLFRLEISL